MESIREAEVDKNFDFFHSIVESLMDDHEGKYVLLRDCKVISIHSTTEEAANEGCSLYPDGRFSLQQVTNAPLDLGFYSHVAGNGEGR